MSRKTPKARLYDVKATLEPAEFEWKQGPIEIEDWGTELLTKDEKAQLGEMLKARGLKASKGKAK